MRSYAAAAAALAGAAIVQAGPTPTDPELPARAASLPAVTASGNAFWTGSTRFYVRGIDYQPGGAALSKDPLTDTVTCKRDIDKFKDLGINTIRVYITDNGKDHDECMKMLADAGIYLIVDTNNPLFSINRDTPHPSYNQVYLQSVFATIDAFAKYDNTLAFFSGNEVIHDQVNTTLAAPYVKATTRDMRGYIKARGYRQIPVGYSAADVSENRLELAQYMNCGPDDERSDFFAFNDYSWCSSNFKESGWDQKVKNFTDYGLPIFLSEYGCNTNTRDFGELSALMSDQMDGVYSGGLMFEYSMEPNKYGIVQVNSDGSAKELPEFAAFKKALAANPAPQGSGNAASTTHSVACPTTGKYWMVDSTLLPAIPEGAKALFQKGAGTGPGLKEPGSQWAEGTSTGDAQPGSGGAASTSTPNAGISRAGPMDKTPFVVCGLTLLFTLCGAVLL